MAPGHGFELPSAGLHWPGRGKLLGFGQVKGVVREVVVSVEDILVVQETGALVVVRSSFVGCPGLLFGAVYVDEGLIAIGIFAEGVVREVDGELGSIIAGVDGGLLRLSYRLSVFAGCPSG